MRITTQRDQFAMLQPWLIEALDLAPGVTAPGGRGIPNEGYGGQKQRRPDLPQTPSPEEAPWMGVDWRTATDYGHLNSTSRPPMSSDVPHPSEVLDPNNKDHIKPRVYNVANPKTGEVTQYHLPSWWDSHQWGMKNDPDRDPYGVKVPYNKVLHITPEGKGPRGGRIKPVITDVTAEHQAALAPSAEDMAKNNLDHHLNQTPEQAYKGRIWYRGAHEGTKDLSDKTIGDHERAVHVMSAYSPKTEWDENLEKGHHFLTHYNGDPENPPVIPGLQSPLKKAIDIYHAHPDDVAKINSGAKTSSFANNILDSTPLREPRAGHDDDSGYYEHAINPHTGEPDWRLHPDQDVTVDTHDVRMKNTRHGDMDAMRALKYGTPPHFEAGFMSNGKHIRPGYDLYARMSAEATHAANLAEEDPHRHLIPKQMQAGPWGKFKDDLNVANNKYPTDVGERPKGLSDRFKMKKNLDRDPDEIEQEWAEKTPLTTPIPRYQKDREDFWTDPKRRPDVNLRETPGWGNRSQVGRPSVEERLRERLRNSMRLAFTDSPWFDSVLSDYIARHPQHPDFAPHLVAATDVLAYSAAVVKNSGPPDFGPDWQRSVMKDIDETGGFSRRGPDRPPEQGYMVSLPGAERTQPADSVTGEDVAAYGGEHWPEMEDDPDVYQGGWKDNPDFFHDLSKYHGDIWDAAKAAHGENDEDAQHAFHDLKNNIDPSPLEFGYNDTPGLWMASKEDQEVDDWLTWA